MGEVFLARQEGPAGFAKNVVIKRILPNLAIDPSFIELFLNEARLAARLDHPHIVQIFELGKDGEAFYIAMEYVHGRSLRSLLHALHEKQQRLPPPIAAQLMVWVLRALACAHEARDDAGLPLGLVHRDATPDNVLVGFNGVVKVGDFGIAKAAQGSAASNSGKLKGKLSYMAPEQVTKGTASPTTDIYSVGVMLYELLAGGRPFVAESDPMLLNLILNDSPEPLEIRAPDVPVPLAELTMRALARDPGARFQSATEMADALEGVLRGLNEPVSERRVAGYLKDLLGEEVAVPLGRSLSNPNLMPVTPSLIGTPRPVSVVTPLPLTPVGQIEGSEPTRDLGDLGTPVKAAQPVAPQPAPAAKRPIGVWVAAAVVLVAVGAGVAWAMRPPPETKPVVAPNLPVEPPKTEPKPERPKPDPIAVVNPTPVPEPVEPKVEPKPKTNGKPVRPVKPKKPSTVATVTPAQTPGPGQTPAPVQAAAPAKVTVRVNPWGDVYFAGQKVGTTPIPPLSMAEGTHQVTARNDRLGKEKTVTISVRSGEALTLKIDLME